MKDSDLRGLVLQKFYDQRRFPTVDVSRDWMEDLRLPSDIQEVDIYRICQQLDEHGLIAWKQAKLAGGYVAQGYGKITAAGVDVIEGAAKPSIAINIQNVNNSHHYSFSNSNNNQVGNNNIGAGSIVNSAVKLQDAAFEKIGASDSSEEQKAEAKGLLQKALEHPLVSSALGALFSSITSN